MSLTILQLNQFSQPDFVRVVGPVFEHSPWIAKATWAKHPFISAQKLHAALCETVINSGEEKQVALIRAHPDLVGRLTIPDDLRQAAGIEESAVFVGLLDRFALWSPSLHQATAQGDTSCTAEIIA